MKKRYLILLLLLPSIFLSSCSIDWNDEKDKKITELEKQITELKSNKELEFERFEFEKQKYQESKVMKAEERKDVFRKECINSKNEFMENTANILNKNCTTVACVNKMILDHKLQLPSDYVDKCLQEKIDGTWKGL